MLGGPGNMGGVTNFCIIQLRCEHTGNLKGVCWNSRFDSTNPDGTANGNIGYHRNNGGTINWTVRRINSAFGVTPLQLGPILGQTANVVNPAGTDIHGRGPWPTWDVHYHAAGGVGLTPERFARFPTINFRTPAPVVAGDWLAFTLNQLGSGGDFISPNDSFSNHRIQGDFSPYSYGEMRHYTNGSLSSYRFNLYPMLVYHYTDGFACGNAHTDYATGTRPTSQLLTGRNVRHREVIPMPAWANGKVIRRVYGLAVRWDNLTTADLSVRIAWEDGSAEGVTLAKTTLTAGSIRYLASRDLKDVAIGPTSDPLPYLIFNFGNVTVVSGRTYYLEFSTTSAGATTTRYLSSRPDRALTAGTVGVRQPSYLLPGMRGQQNNGAGWFDLVGTLDDPDVGSNARIHDIPLWAEFV